MAKIPWPHKRFKDIFLKVSSDEIEFISTIKRLKENENE